jgi:hypothetical protein
VPGSRPLRSGRVEIMSAREIKAIPSATANNGSR